ncbi:hypothetical protein EJ05DRAFT_136645 [Pseudovirgaria hyperparasitica]|uniref:Uncharacterized protein n=1 Tax=Pseudovirgaria hyperparasitica TaxID=470096 RepID=A0A6A6VYG6_9PEZI|nr:uncharacterized protein EJ05DRAFT_136645 [Pseudovirgaria hyperparasitica]KAF2754866.1 hypothetical protein EJ05DRAFT_136645 [Pseudovirgaria hyperparasitica]
MALLDARTNPPHAGLAPFETLANRSSSPPPPYQSRESTGPEPDYQYLFGLVAGSNQDEPPELEIDEDEWEARAMVLERSTPRKQFMQQVKKIHEQIIKQRTIETIRRPTHRIDDTQDLIINAENIVRARWVEQKIWKSSWGPAWPPSARSGWRQDILHSRKGPWVPERARWGHEVELDGEDKPDREEVDIDASRPLYQFKFQVGAEQKWIQDEALSLRGTSLTASDLEQKAYETIKAEWTELEIWNPDWSEYPGMSWMHADQLDTTWGIIQPPVPLVETSSASTTKHPPTTETEPTTIDPNSIRDSVDSASGPSDGSGHPKVDAGTDKVQPAAASRSGPQSKAEGKGKRGPRKRSREGEHLPTVAQISESRIEHDQESRSENDRGLILKSVLM